MTDLELTKLCAEAMGFKCNEWSHLTPPQKPSCIAVSRSAGPWMEYDPLNYDDQAMALVRRFKLSIGYSDGWGCRLDVDGEFMGGSFHYPDLNRAIVECVAKLPVSAKKGSAPAPVPDEAPGK